MNVDKKIWVHNDCFQRPNKLWTNVSRIKAAEFHSWLQQCPIPYDFSHDIENEDDWQIYIYFILDKEVQDE